MSKASGAKRGGDDAGEIDVSSLSVAQLQGLMKQVEQEVAGLKQSYTALKSAEQRFRSSKEAVAELKTTPEGAESLIPMTGSLFVHGTVKTSAKLLVDVGAGFYVGKSTTAAVDILGRKEAGVRATTEDIARQIREKESTAEAISQVLYMKSQQAAAGGAAGRS